MRAIPGGFRVDGNILFRGRKGRAVMVQELHIEYDLTAARALISSRFTALGRGFIRRVQGLCLAIPNDRFNGFSRHYHSKNGTLTVAFEPAAAAPVPRGGFPARILRRLDQEFGWSDRCHDLSSPWINIDDVLGIIDRGGSPAGFRLRCPNGRNHLDGSLHFDLLLAPERTLYRRARPGELLLDSRFELIAADAASTKALSEAPDAR
jgi:hypothetical protein